MANTIENAERALDSAGAATTGYAVDVEVKGLPGRFFLEVEVTLQTARQWRRCQSHPQLLLQQSIGGVKDP